MIFFFEVLPGNVGSWCLSDVHIDTCTCICKLNADVEDQSISEFCSPLLSTLVFFRVIITIISTLHIRKINKYFRSCCLTWSIIDVEMAATLSFRWLDILEKEFDKAFVDLDLLLGEIDPDQCELTYDGRQKMTALSAAFAQLCHKSQTVFQSNAKIEVIDLNMFFFFINVILKIQL